MLLDLLISRLFVLQGKDANSEILRASAEKGGVKVAYVHDETTPTGTIPPIVHQPRFHRAQQVSAPCL